MGFLASTILGAGCLCSSPESRQSKSDKDSGFDASPAGKQAVFENKLYDSPQQFPDKMARGTVQAFMDYLEGKELLKNNFIPCAHYNYQDAVEDPNRVKEQW